jgi:hypothetical protein
VGLTEKLTGWASDALGSALSVAGQIGREALEKASQGAARGTVLPEQREARSPHALFADPFAVVDALGYKDRPSSMSYQTIAELARRMPVLGAIRTTRINQAASFLVPVESEREPGFVLKMRDRDATPSRSLQRRMREISEFLLTTGVTANFDKDSLDTFGRKLLRDSMTYDQACFEVVTTRRGEVCDFYAVDGASIRLAEAPLGYNPHADAKRARYVQVYDETVIAEFPSDALCFGIRNPNTSLRTNGYGESEIEQMVAVVTALLFNFSWNTKAFSQGTAARGILNLRGNVPDAQLDAFRRSWYQMLSGVSNAFRTPVISHDDVQWINLQTSNRDMEFAAWMDWLVKVACAIYQIDPAEINFVYGNSGQASTMFAASASERATASRDRGLRPLLRSMAGWLNRYVVTRLDPRLRLEFTGLNDRSVDQDADLQKKQVSYLKTVDEIRAEADLEPLPDKRGDVILDPTYLQWYQLREQAKQQEQQAQQPGGGDAQQQGMPGGGGGAGGMLQSSPWGDDQGDGEQGGDQGGGEQEPPEQEEAPQEANVVEDDGEDAAEKSDRRRAFVFRL